MIIGIHLAAGMEVDLTMDLIIHGILYLPAIQKMGLGKGIMVIITFEMIKVIDIACGIFLPVIIVDISAIQGGQTSRAYVCDLKDTEKSGIHTDIKNVIIADKCSGILSPYKWNRREY